MKKEFFVKTGANQEKVQKVLAKLSKEQLASIAGGEYGNTPFSDYGSEDPLYVRYGNYAESTRPR